MYYQNIRGLDNKIQELYNSVSCYITLMISLHATWLTSIVLDGEHFEQNYVNR